MNMSKNKNLVLIATAVVMIAGLIFVFNKMGSSSPEDSPVVCAMDVKICPDGSAVGRTGPNCEFAECPEAPKKTGIECQEEQRNVDVCMQVYQPVCATVNVQCVTTPCDPAEQTFSNSCVACQNPLVSSYVEGECGIE